MNRTKIDISDNCGRASAVLETGKDVFVLSINQQFKHESSTARVFLTKAQAMELRNLLNDNLN